jgi:hypothetical protein
MEYAHGNLFEIEKKSQLLQELLKDYPYLDSQHVTSKPSHSQVSSHFESWSPDGLPNFQGKISGVRTHWIEELFLSLESY